MFYTECSERRDRWAR